MRLVADNIAVIYEYEPDEEPLESIPGVLLVDASGRKLLLRKLRKEVTVPRFLQVMRKLLEFKSFSTVPRMFFKSDKNKKTPAVTYCKQAKCPYMGDFLIGNCRLNFKNPITPKNSDFKCPLMNTIIRFLKTDIYESEFRGYQNLLDEIKAGVKDRNPDSEIELTDEEVLYG